MGLFFSCSLKESLHGENRMRLVRKIDPTRPVPSSDRMCQCAAAAGLATRVGNDVWVGRGVSKLAAEAHTPLPTHTSFP